MMMRQFFREEWALMMRKRSLVSSCFQIAFIIATARLGIVGSSEDALFATILLTLYVIGVCIRVGYSLRKAYIRSKKMREAA